MRVLIDTCVLYPTMLRRLVCGFAEAEAFTPLWSARILEEWARVADREGLVAGVAARGEIAALSAQFPGARVSFDETVEQSLSLPDENDRHVLAAAIAGRADELVTLNVRDFPMRALAGHGILRRHPDEFLLEAVATRPDLWRVVDGVYDRAVAEGAALSARGLLKRARLPRLGKAIETRS